MATMLSAMDSDSHDQPAFSKAERVAIGGAVAASVRQQARAPRAITLVGKDGKPVGVTTTVEVAQSLLARSQIEFSVQEGKRPAFVNCKTCGRPVKVKGGTIPIYCLPGTHSCPCGAPLGRAKYGCRLGTKCKKCANRANGMRRSTVSDVEIAEALATSVTFKDAAAKLGTHSRSLRRRAINAGMAPQGGISRKIGGQRGSATKNAEARARRALTAQEDSEKMKTALIASGGRLRVAAAAMSISERTMYRRIRELGIWEWLEQGNAGGSQFRRPTLVKRGIVDSMAAAAST